jgi:hypothetical protein
MRPTNQAPTEASVTDVQARAGTRALQSWVRPRLVRVGSVAQVTAKVDKVGRNDGGSGGMRRT